MYTVDTAAIARARLASTSGLLAVTPIVWWLGLTSLFTDVSTEMVYSTLPAYLVLHLGFSPLSFGLVDSSYHGTGALLRIVSALFTDRLRRYKEVASAGYCLSAVAKLALLAGTSSTAIAASVAVDRTGKGIRTAPRDALVTLNSPSAHLGVAFGVHRALDAMGAMLGPLLAYVMLEVPGGGYDALFLASFCAALVGLSAIGLFVRNPGAPDAGATPPALGLVVAVFRSRAFGRVALVAALVGALTIGDGFIYLLLQRRLHLAPSAFPLLAFASAAAYMLTAVPLGRLADRVGRGAVFAGGHLALVALYGCLATLPQVSAPLGILCLALLGLYYAATDGVLAALTASVLDREVLTTGLAVVGTITGVARAAASVAFGAAWTAFGDAAATAAFAVGLLVATALAAVTVRRLQRA